MTDDERALEPGRVLLELRNKGQKLNELKSRAVTIVKAIGQALKRCRILQERFTTWELPITGRTKERLKG